MIDRIAGGNYRCRLVDPRIAAGPIAVSGCGASRR
jgi:hypothetical protein